MAGSFGYEKEHYDLSLKIAELGLFKSARACSDDTALVAAGVSCRQQIEHGLKRKAYHPAEVLWQRVEKTR